VEKVPQEIGWLIHILFIHIRRCKTMTKLSLSEDQEITMKGVIGETQISIIFVKFCDIKIVLSMSL